MREAKVLRLLRYDARRWWYHQALRQQGRLEEARRAERRAIRQEVRFIRENIGRRAITHRTDCIEFPDRENRTKPFDLKPTNALWRCSYTASVSGCHPGGFAAWVYCYANRIGLKYRAKTSDLV